MTRIGSLFSGYGGLEAGVQAVVGGTVAWHCETDPGASKILTHYWPETPNLGDITKVDWTQVEPVDVITGGSPCQDVSHAGKREGMRAGTRSGLWASMCDAINIIRPSLVVWENVRGVLSAGADSAVGSCAICVGNERQPDLRALGRVVGDLSELRYDTQWVGLRAADVGAPHGRFRVFVAAWPAADTEHDGRPAPSFRRSIAAGESDRRLLEPEGPPAYPRLMPTPTSDDAGNLTRTSGEFQSLTRVVVSLLPTPAVNDMGEGKTPDAWDEWTATMKAKHGNGNGHGPSLAIEAQRLLPTPTAPAPHDSADGAGTLREKRAGYGDELTTISYGRDWGIYADAIRRWEMVLGRVAPPPTILSRKGTPQLSPKFSEFLMGLPEGHVTGVPGLSRNDMLKCLGNGVVPAQAATALAYLLTLIPWAVAA